MTHFGYVISGYGLTAGIIGAYALWMRARHRALLAFDEQGRTDGDRERDSDGDVPGSA